MPNLFYNPAERRLRAFWRILLQGGLYLVGSVLIGIAVLLPFLVGQALRTGEAGAAARFVGGSLANALAILASAAAQILAILAAAKWLDRRRLAAYGFHISRGWLRDFAFGLGLGAALMTLIFSAEWALGWLEIKQVLRIGDLSGLVSVGLALLLFVGVGIYEEAWTRGYLLRNLAEGLNLPLWGPVRGPKIAITAAYIASSIFFGLLHFSNPNATWTSTVNIMAAGIFLGLGCLLTGELAIPIGIHITWNFFQGNVYGFPVSGGSYGASLVQITQVGPPAWTGAAFGPEGGWIGIAAIVFGCAAILAYLRLTGRPLRLHEGLARYQGPERPTPN